MTVTEEIRAGQLAELVKQLQAGNEVLLTQDSKPVAKLVPASERVTAPADEFVIHSVPGHKVLTPFIRSEDIAEEMFGR